MDGSLNKINEQGILAPSGSPIADPSLVSFIHSGKFSLANKISPTILLMIIVLSIVFFISGCLHLLVRMSFRSNNNTREEEEEEEEDVESVTDLQGQLHQLFNLHDSGVDQSFIDSLPVFLYRDITGAKTPLDCVVCLCEFEEDDKLRLLPSCNHAFHLQCIDIWILSHSTCPLCRRNLMTDFPQDSRFSPVVLVIESENQNPRETVTNIEAIDHSHDLSLEKEQIGSSHVSIEIEKRGEQVLEESETIIVPVKLGRFRNIDYSVTNNKNNVDSRRSYSMGSLEYVMDCNSNLQVTIKTPARKKVMNLFHGRINAISERHWHSNREGSKKFDMKERTTDIEPKVGKMRKEVFFPSKFCLPTRKERMNPAKSDLSRRAFSFRLPFSSSTPSDSKMKAKSIRRISSEIDLQMWRNKKCEFSFDEEDNDCNKGTPDIFSTFTSRTESSFAGSDDRLIHSPSTQNSEI